MTTPEDLGILRAFVGVDTEDRPAWFRDLSAATSHLLFDYANLLCNLEDAHQLLKDWGIPTKQRRAEKLDGAGFEKGWDNE